MSAVPLDEKRPFVQLAFPSSIETTGPSVKQFDATKICFLIALYLVDHLCLVPPVHQEGEQKQAPGRDRPA